MNITDLEAILRLARKNNVIKLVIGQSGDLTVEFGVGVAEVSRRSRGVVRKQKAVEAGAIRKEEFRCKEDELDHMAIENPSGYEELITSMELHKDDIFGPSEIGENEEA